MSQHDGRAIEEACKGTLFERGVQLSGAVVEAAYAAADPDLLRRLRATLVPFIVDTQSLRFSGEAFLDVKRIIELPFAPTAPIDALDFSEASARALAQGTMRFADEAGAAAYVLPGLPVYDRDRSNWVTANRRIFEAACEANGTGGIERRP